MCMSCFHLTSTFVSILFSTAVKHRSLFHLSLSSSVPSLHQGLHRPPAPIYQSNDLLSTLPSSISSPLFPPRLFSCFLPSLWCIHPSCHVNNPECLLNAFGKDLMYAAIQHVIDKDLITLQLITDQCDHF